MIPHPLLIAIGFSIISLFLSQRIDRLLYMTSQKKQISILGLIGYGLCQLICLFGIALACSMEI